MNNIKRILQYCAPWIFGFGFTSIIGVIVVFGLSSIDSEIKKQQKIEDKCTITETLESCCKARANDLKYRNKCSDIELIEYKKKYKIFPYN